MFGDGRRNLGYAEVIGAVPLFGNAHMIVAMVAGGDLRGQV